MADAADTDRSLAGLGLTHLAHAGPAPDMEAVVTGLAVDSRAVRPGHVFIAVPGTRLDGARFAKYAVRQGALAVVASRAGVETARADIGDLPVPFFVADNPRAELARLAAAYFGAQPERLAAVTATNGKTSVVQFLRQIWAAAGHRAASLGTLGVEGPGFDEPLAHTTPEPITLHAVLARLATKGCTHAALEASSHGLAQHRLDGVRLTAAALGRITRDHMDYHASHEDYVAAKLGLIEAVLAPGATAVLAADDAIYTRARATAEARGQGVISVGRGTGADLRITGQQFRPSGQRVGLAWEESHHCADLALIGAFQAENVALAAALALATGIPSDRVFAALPELRGVRGRMERVAVRANGAPVYVDYAHTPDALATALRALRPHCAGRLVVVFGAGGDRDRGKRPLMGRAAAEGADTVIVTDDNPRSEDPAAIRAEILTGCPEAEGFAERRAAILAGVDALKAPGDCLVIAGKGHEQGQETGDQILPFDDGDQARAAVAALDGIETELGGGQ